MLVNFEVIANDLLINDVFIFGDKLYYVTQSSMDNTLEVCKIGEVTNERLIYKTPTHFEPFNGFNKVNKLVVTL